MTIRTSGAVLAVALLVATGTAAAQVRIGRDGGQPAPNAGRIRESPSTRSTAVPRETLHPPSDARLTNTLKFEPRDLDGRLIPFPLPVGLGWTSFGYVPFWWWNGVLPAQGLAGPAVPIPSAEGAPVGGVQLDIEPRRARVYVDGDYVGVVSDFSGYYQHLALVAGQHLVTIIAPDYEPLIIQVMVSPGRATTHRGSLARAYGR
jgi:hypothetical protein